MSAPLSRFTLPVCLCLLAAPGCSKKGAKTRASHEALAKVPPVKADPLPIPKASPHIDQLGHFVVDDVLSLWTQVNQLISEPGTSKMPELRATLQSQLPDSKIPSRLLLNQPMGCVVYDPMQYMAEKSWPGVCFFSYQGGAKAFIEDLGNDIKPLDPQGHRFHANIKDKSLFVDELDNTVIISGETSRFAASTQYIKSNILRREVQGAGLSFDVYAADIYQRYEPLINQEIESLIESKGTEFALMGSDKKKSSETFKKILDIFRESDQFSFGIHSKEHRYVISSSLRVKAEAPAWKKMITQGKQSPITTDLIARMPKGLVMLAANSLTPGDSSWNTENTLIRWRWFAKTLKQDEAWAQDMVKREQAFSKYLGKQAAMGMVASDQGPGSLITMVQAAPGASLQEKWRSELEALPSMDFGASFKRNFAIQFTPKAKTVDGVALDELKITATQAARNELKSSMGQKSYDELVAWLGSMSLVIHLGQVEHIAFAVSSTHSADAASSKAVAALRGVNNFALDPEFASIAKKFTGNNFAAVLDSGALSRFLQSAQTGGQGASQDARNGFQDSQIISRMDAEQGTAMIGSISSPLVPLFVKAAKRGSKLGTLAR